MYFNLIAFLCTDYQFVPAFFMLKSLIGFFSLNKAFIIIIIIIIIVIIIIIISIFSYFKIALRAVLTILSMSSLCCLACCCLNTSFIH